MNTKENPTQDEDNFQPNTPNNIKNEDLTEGTISDNDSSKCDESNVPYRTGRWHSSEHQRFIKGCLLYGNNWRKVKECVKTRSSAQIRSHAQKYIIKLSKKYQQQENIKQITSMSNINNLIASSALGIGGTPDSTILATLSKELRGDKAKIDSLSSDSVEEVILGIFKSSNEPSKLKPNDLDILNNEVKDDTNNPKKVFMTHKDPQIKKKKAGVKMNFTGEQVNNLYNSNLSDPNNFLLDPSINNNNQVLMDQLVQLMNITDTSKNMNNSMNHPMNNHPMNNHPMNNHSMSNHSMNNSQMNHPMNNNQMNNNQMNNNQMNNNQMNNNQMNNSQMNNNLVLLNTLMNPVDQTLLHKNPLDDILFSYLNNAVAPLNNISNPFNLFGNSTDLGLNGTLPSNMNLNSIMNTLNTNQSSIGGHNGHNGVNNSQNMNSLIPELNINTTNKSNFGEDNVDKNLQLGDTEQFADIGKLDSLKQLSDVLKVLFKDPNNLNNTQINNIIPEPEKKEEALITSQKPEENVNKSSISHALNPSSTIDNPPIDSFNNTNDDLNMLLSLLGNTSANSSSFNYNPFDPSLFQLLDKNTKTEENDSTIMNSNKGRLESNMCSNLNNLVNLSNFNNPFPNINIINDPLNNWLNQLANTSLLNPLSSKGPFDNFLLNGLNFQSDFPTGEKLTNPHDLLHSKNPEK